MHAINAYEGVELNLHSFLDSALHEVRGYASVALLSEKEPLIPIDQEAGWPSDLVFTFWEKDECIFPCQELNRSSLFFQPMAYSDYTIPPALVPYKGIKLKIKYMVLGPCILFQLQKSHSSD